MNNETATLATPEIAAISVPEKKETSFATRPLNGFDIDPKDFDAAHKDCEYLSKTNFIPKEYIGKPGDIFACISMGRELGISAMQSLQGIKVINGKPSLYGDVGKALLISRGCKITMPNIKEVSRLAEATVTIERPGFPTTTHTFTKEMARVGGLIGKQGPWTTSPERQMSWRAFWFVGRDIASDILCGMIGTEELMDIDPDKVIAAEIIPAPKRLEAPIADASNAPASQAGPIAPVEPVSESAQPELIPTVPGKFDRNNARPVIATIKNVCMDCLGIINRGDALLFSDALKKGVHQECPPKKA